MSTQLCSSGPATSLSSNDNSYHNDFMDIIQSTVSNTAEENTKKVDLPSQTTRYKTLHGWGPKITPGTGCTLDANHKSPSIWALAAGAVDTVRKFNRYTILNTAGTVKTVRQFNRGIQSYPYDGCAQDIDRLKDTVSNNIQTVDITSSGRLATERNDSTIKVQLQSDDILKVQSMPPDACRNGCSINDKCHAWVATNGTCIHHNDNIRNTAGDINGVPTDGVRMHVKDASISTNKSCHGPYTHGWPGDECHDTAAKGQENFLRSNDNITLVGLYKRDIHSSIIPPRDRSRSIFATNDVQEA